MPEALFYPWIDITDESWLKTSLLYWDSIRTIVPESIETPYSTETGRALREANFLVPLRVYPAMEEIKTLTEDTLSFLDSPEGTELLLAGGTGSRHPVHVDKLPQLLPNFVDIHPEKLPYKVRQMVRRFFSADDQKSDWLRVNDGFANFYMTLLASRLAERVGARLLTSLPAADQVAQAARFDAQMDGLNPLGGPYSRRSWRESQAFGRRVTMPKHLAPGLLASLIIERVGINPDTSIDRLIKFREQHRDELALFRAKVDELASSVNTDLPVEALLKQIDEIHAHKVAPAISNLKMALKGRRIQWMSEGLLKVAFLSTGATAMLVVAGLAAPIALLAGAGVSLAVSGIRYNVDKEELLRANPFAYMLSVERSVGLQR